MSQRTKGKSETTEHEIFRQMVLAFLREEYAPNLLRWEKRGYIELYFWKSCVRIGLFYPTAPETYEGADLNFSYNAIIDEDMGYYEQMAGTILQLDIVLDYVVNFAAEPLKRATIPKMISGAWISAIAITEPGAGSDLRGIRTTAKRDGDAFVVNGSKTYITNGQSADIIAHLWRYFGDHARDDRPLDLTSRRVDANRE